MEDIEWASIKDGSYIREKILSELKLMGIKVDVGGKFDKKKAFIKLDKFIDENLTDIHSDI